MRIRILLTYFMIFIIYEVVIINAQINQSSNCGLGCAQCNQVCSKCNQGFELNIDTHKCINNQCQDGLFYQNEIPINNQSKCKSMCDSSHFQSIEQKMCIKLEECSLSYRSIKNISMNDSLYDIVSYTDDFILLVYKKSITYIRRTNGNIEYQTLINDNISSFYIFGNELIVIQDNSIFKWDLLYNKYILLTKLILKTYQKQSDVQLMIVNKQTITSVFVSGEQQIILIQQQFNFQNMEIKQNNLFQIEYSSQNKVQLYQSSILQIGDQGIRIDVVELDINKNIIVKNFTQKKYYCENLISKNLKMVEYVTISQTYLLIFDKSQFIYKINQEQCILFDQQQNPSKISYFNLESIDYFVIKFSTSLNILDNNLNTIKKFEYQPVNVIDFVINSSQINQVVLFILLNNNFIYHLNINIDNKEVKFTQIDQYIEVQIINPTQLFYFPKIQVNNKKSRLFIAGNEVQSNIILNENNQNNDEKQEYLIINFEFSYDFVQSKIISSLILNDLNIFIACSQEGFFAWDISHIYSSKILYFFKTHDLCVDIYSIQNSDIIVVFTTKIMMIQPNNFTIKQTFNLNSSTSVSVPNKVSFQQNYGILIMDSYLFCYDYNNLSLNKLQFSDFSNNIQFIQFQQDDILIIQFVQSFKLYKIDFQNNSVTSYSEKQLPSKIIKTKIRNFPQKKFEIVTYLENKTFLILDQNLITIIEVLNFPLSSLIDIQFLQSDPTDDAYFLLGRTVKVSTTFPVEEYFLSKQNTKPMISFAVSSGNFLLEPIKKLDSNNVVYYQSYLLYWLSTYTMLASLNYYPSNQVQYFVDLIYIFQCLNAKVHQANGKKNYILADVQGYVGANAFKNDIYKVYYKVSQQDYQQKNIITKITQCYALNKLFIIKTKTILIFNIHTNILEEEIIFTSNPQDSIQTFAILEQESVLIVCKKGVLLLKDFNKNILLSYEDSFISNFHIYSKNQQTYILVYGNKVQSLKLDLTYQIQSSYTVEKDTIQNCIVSKGRIICQLTKNNQIIILLEENFKLQNTIFIKQQNENIQLYLDEDYNKIYLCSKKMEIYSYDGKLISLVENFPERVSEFKIIGDSIILIQSAFQSCKLIAIIFIFLFNIL